MVCRFILSVNSYPDSEFINWYTDQHITFEVHSNCELLAKSASRISCYRI